MIPFHTTVQLPNQALPLLFSLPDLLPDLLPYFLPYFLPYLSLFPPVEKHISSGSFEFSLECGLVSISSCNLGDL